MKKLILILLLNVTFLFAQKEVSGYVFDNAGTPLAGVNVTEKGTSNSVSSDFNGAYQINVKEGSILVFSYVGFPKQEFETTETILNVFLTEERSQGLNEIVVTGTRTAPRSNTATALPIDVITGKELTSTGQITFDKGLQYRIPSFNTVQTPVNDATSLLDPYEIRNMGPSRTLILINGKRKNLSSLLYIQISPGRGETGADLSAIPVDAIERVEILRDGASAQYGSDAIAGVINIILKKRMHDGGITARSGTTAKGDGGMIGVSLNNGSTVNDKGFINYTIDFSKTNLTNRPGRVEVDGEFTDNGGSIQGLNTLSDITSFLTKFPNARNINGAPETAAAKFLVNGGLNLSDETQLYYNAAYVYKKVNSFANYRTPYWNYGHGITSNDLPYLYGFFGNNTADSYQGYHPTFTADLHDYNATLGFQSVRNGWNTDVSITVGGNSQNYTVDNSHNRSAIKDTNGINVYQENSPISFKPGGAMFSHIVGNLDFSKVLSDKISIAFGSEIRTETFEILEGDKASWEGFGTDSFSGNRPEDSGKWNRYNLGGYFDLAYDLSQDFLVNGTIRYEDYSDFGAATVWKISTRYKFLQDQINLRGSVSTGFRAPTLHQIYSQKSQYSFVPGQGVQISGLVNNVSVQARVLGIPKLDAEKSTNITVGLGSKLLKKLNFTLDYYNIKVENRIILGDRVATDFGSVSWFENSFDSRTSGLDIVVNYAPIPLGVGEIKFNLSGNITLENKRISPLTNDNFGATFNALMFSSRPDTKWILGANYKVNKFDFAFYNTYFGKATFKQEGLNQNLKTEFIPKIVTDVAINFFATSKLTVSMNINNLLNVLPEWKFKAENSSGNAILNNPTQLKTQYNLITFNGRYSQMTYEGYHFSQLGTLYNLSLCYKF